MSANIYFEHEYPDTTIINTAAVVTAIRCQKNHYRTDVITTDIVDPDSSNCYACPYYKKGVNCTKSCDQKQFVKKQVRAYINERNHFGYKYELPALAIKLFLYLHFLRSDKFGYLRIELEEAATILSCSRRCRNVVIFHMQKVHIQEHTKCFYCRQPKTRKPHPRVDVVILCYLTICLRSFLDVRRSMN